jgi:hypothetical protein
MSCTTTFLYFFFPLAAAARFLPETPLGLASRRSYFRACARRTATISNHFVFGINHPDWQKTPIRSYPLYQIFSSLSVSTILAFSLGDPTLSSSFPLHSTIIMMRAALLSALLSALLVIATASDLVIRSSTGPSTFAGGLVRDSSYKASA